MMSKSKLGNGYLYGIDSLYSCVMSSRIFENTLCTNERSQVSPAEIFLKFKFIPELYYIAKIATHAATIS